MDIKSILKQYWNSIAVQDEERIRKYFHEDACIRWHNTNEQFNVEEFIKTNCDYPGIWNSEVERLEQMEGIVVTVTRVWTNEISFHVTSFFEILDGKIKKLDEYWGDDGTAPQWRKDKHLGKLIHQN